MKPFVLAATVLALACQGNPPAPASGPNAPSPAAEPAKAAGSSEETPPATDQPELELRAEHAAFDPATRTLNIPNASKVIVRDPSGTTVHEVEPAELARVYEDAAAKRDADSPPARVVLTAQGADGSSHQSTHALTSLAHDAATNTTSLVLDPKQGDEVPGALSNPTIVMGRFPTHIACCDCDWKCILGWTAGYCSTCLSGTVGASSCCQVCDRPASPGGSC